VNISPKLNHDFKFRHTDLIKGSSHHRLTGSDGLAFLVGQLDHAVALSHIKLANVALRSFNPKGFCEPCVGLWSKHGATPPQGIECRVCARFRSPQLSIGQAAKRDSPVAVFFDWVCLDQRAFGMAANIGATWGARPKLEAVQVKAIGINHITTNQAGWLRAIRTDHTSFHWPSLLRRFILVLLLLQIL
jgi:hypothetical protein